MLAGVVSRILRWALSHQLQLPGFIRRKRFVVDLRALKRLCWNGVDRAFSTPAELGPQINSLAVGCIHNFYRRNAGYRFNTPITSVLSSSELLQTLSDSNKSTISASPSLTDRSSFAYENTGRKKRSYGVNSPFVLRRPAR